MEQLQNNAVCAIQMVIDFTPMKSNTQAQQRINVPQMNRFCNAAGATKALKLAKWS